MLLVPIKCKGKYIHAHARIFNLIILCNMVVYLAKVSHDGWKIEPIGGAAVSTGVYHSLRLSKAAGCTIIKLIAKLLPFGNTGKNIAWEFIMNYFFGKGSYEFIRLSDIFQGKKDISFTQTQEVAENILPALINTCEDIENTRDMVCDRSWINIQRTVTNLATYLFRSTTRDNCAYYTNMYTARQCNEPSIQESVLTMSDQILRNLSEYSGLLLTVLVLAKIFGCGEDLFDYFNNISKKAEKKGTKKRKIIPKKKAGHEKTKANDVENPQVKKATKKTKKTKKKKAKKTKKTKKTKKKKAKKTKYPQVENRTTKSNDVKNPQLGRRKVYRTTKSNDVKNPQLGRRKVHRTNQYKQREKSQNNLGRRKISN